MMHSRKQKQRLLRAINTCKELLREPFLRAQEMQTLYRNGEAFRLLQSETQLLAALPTLLPSTSAHQQTQIENFALSLALLGEKKAEIDALLPDFLAREAGAQAEKQLNEKIEQLYLLHAAFYQEFSLFCEQLLPQLEEKFQQLCKVG